MGSRLWNWLRLPLRRPDLAIVSVLFVAILGYLAWLGGSALWIRWERKEVDRALAEYDFVLARERLQTCIKLRPREPELRLVAAEAARRDGDLAFAEEQLNVHRDLVGEATPRETLERALVRAQRGEVHEVLDYLIAALDAHHPESEHILEALALGCIQVYQFNRALFWVQELLQKWPTNAIGKLLRAQTISTQGDRSKAVAIMREVVNEFPKYYKARLSLADTLFKSSIYREAVAEYAILMQQRPREVLPLLGLATCYVRLGALEEARPLMQRLEESFPDNSEVLLECGRFALSESRPADAERLLRHAVELAPNDHEIHRELSVCLDRLGKHSEARQHLERFKQMEADLILLEKTLAAIAKAPNDPAPRREAGEICLRNGQTAEGLRWLHGVLEILPNDKPTHRILANFYASQRDEERAAQHRRKAQ